MSAARFALISDIHSNMEALEAAWVRFAGEDSGESYLQALRECLETTDERSREALNRRFRERSSYNEIGERMELEREGVKTLLRRAKEKLHGCIQGKLHE